MNPPEAVAHYALLERQPEDGHGEPFRARDTHLGRIVSLRLLPDGVPAAPDARAALVAQAKDLAALSHPNITALFDAGEHDGRIYLAFELLQGGRPLGAAIGGTPMDLRRAIAIAIEVADAVAEMHAVGVVHGALGTDSIDVTAGGHAKVQTFALVVRSGGVSKAGAAFPGDGSPEEAQGRPPDDRSDIHAVGAVLFEMLTATPPRDGAAVPSAVNPRVPAELDAVLAKALAVDPDARLQSVATLAAELRSVAAILDVRRAIVREKASPGARSWMGRAVVVAATAIVALGVVAWWLMRS